MKDDETYTDFWRTYVLAHQRRANRVVHCVGIVAAGGGLISAAAWGQAWIAVASVAVGYGLSWFGHFVIEGNRPETFRRPLWSLISAFRMAALTIAGRDLD